jgi:NADH:ubiquinone oxidoreductase subunit
VTKVAATKEKGNKPNKRSDNYSEEEKDVALCHAWMNVSLDASVGTNQCKDKFWQRIEEHYLNVVKISSYRAQGSLSHRWGAILDCCNRWSGAYETVNNSPPSGVPITQYIPLQEEVYKHHNNKGGHKAFTLFHFYKELEGNERWPRRNYEITTPKRSRITTAIDADDDDEEEDLNNRPEGGEIAKEKKKRGGAAAYKDEFNAIIETKKAL